MRKYDVLTPCRALRGFSRSLTILVALSGERWEWFSEEQDTHKRGEQGNIRIAFQVKPGFRRFFQKCEKVPGIE